MRFYPYPTTTSRSHGSLGAGTRFRKSDWYSVWQGHRKFDIFPERDEKVHGRQRSLISRAYSLAALSDLEPYVDNTIRHFFKKLDEIRHASIDMGYWTQLFAFGKMGCFNAHC